MKKHQKLISKVYKISMTVFTALFICAILGCLAHLVFTSSMFDKTNTDPVYSPEKVGSYLQWLSIPFGIYVAAIIFGAVFYTIYPQKVNEFAKARPVDTVKRVHKFSLSEIENPEHRKILKRNKILRICLICFTSIIAIFCFVVTSLYLSNPENYILDSKVIERNAMTFVGILPYVLITAVWGLTTVFILDFTSKQDIIILKNEKMFKLDKLYKQTIDPEVRNITTNIVRIIVFLLAVTFIILGVFNGGVKDVFIKAINICTECIGLG